MLQAWNLSKQSQSTKRVFQLYGCVVTSRDMVSHKDPTRHFDKVTDISWTTSRFVVFVWNFSVIKTLSHSIDVLSLILTFQHYHVGIVFSHYTGHVLKPSCLSDLVLFTFLNKFILKSIASTFYRFFFMETSTLLAVPQLFNSLSASLSNLKSVNLQADYYAHPEHYAPVFHERIAPYASVIGMALAECLYQMLFCCAL